MQDIARDLRQSCSDEHRSKLKRLESIYVIESNLSPPHKTCLLHLLSAGKHPVRKCKRALILLAAHAEQNHTRIAAILAVGESTVDRSKRRGAAPALILTGARIARQGEATTPLC